MERKEKMAGVTFTGSVTFNGPMFDIHDNDNVYLSVDKAEVKKGQQVTADKGEKRSLPEVLMTEKAKEMMMRLVDADILTDQWQPKKLSGTEYGLVAKMISERLGINDVWQVFGSLWDEKPETLRSYFNKAYGQKKSLCFQDQLKNILD